jgi:hypothetical protein
MFRLSFVSVPRAWDVGQAQISRREGFGLAPSQRFPMRTLVLAGIGLATLIASSFLSLTAFRAHAGEPSTVVQLPGNTVEVTEPCRELRHKFCTHLLGVGRVLMPNTAQHSSDEQGPTWTASFIDERYVFELLLRRAEGRNASSVASARLRELYGTYKVVESSAPNSSFAEIRFDAAHRNGRTVHGKIIVKHGDVYLAAYSVQPSKDVAYKPEWKVFVESLQVK